jgi:hypothetical protein
MEIQICDYTKKGEEIGIFECDLKPEPGQIVVLRNLAYRVMMKSESSFVVPPNVLPQQLRVYVEPLSDTPVVNITEVAVEAR